MEEKEEGKELLYFFSTHPFPGKRIEAIERAVREGKHPVKEKAALHEALTGVE
jgi:predicted Zn-dependent protease